jgi:hypothetical protein
MLFRDDAYIDSIRLREDFATLLQPQHVSIIASGIGRGRPATFDFRIETRARDSGWSRKHHSMTMMGLSIIRSIVAMWSKVNTLRESGFVIERVTIDLSRVDTLLLDTAKVGHLRDLIDSGLTDSRVELEVGVDLLVTSAGTRKFLQDTIAASSASDHRKKVFQIIGA